MSFIKRADGTIVYGGSHATSRGSLASLRHGSDAPLTPEDMEWEKKVLAAASGLDTYPAEIVDYYYEDNFEGMDEDNAILKLWGIYKRAEPVFNSKYFEPSGR